MSYIRKQQCPTCNEPNWFRYWVGKHCDKSVSGLAVMDFDLLFHRFRTVDDKIGSRSVEHLMLVEVKVGDEQVGRAQRDTLSVFNGLLMEMVPVNGAPIKVRSRPGYIVPGEKAIKWEGVHLLRIPREPTEVGPFVWDDRWELSASQLVKILNFEHDAYEPHKKLDNARRHKAAKPKPAMPLFQLHK